MGLCASSRKPVISVNRGAAAATEKGLISEWSTSSTVRIIHIDGKVEEYRQQVWVRSIKSQNPRCFVCSSESMNVDSCPPQVPDDEMLQPGQIYFLLPLSTAQKPLSLPDLCDLAIKASISFPEDEFRKVD